MNALKLAALWSLRASGLVLSLLLLASWCRVVFAVCLVVLGLGIVLLARRNSTLRRLVIFCECCPWHCFAWLVGGAVLEFLLLSLAFDCRVSAPQFSDYKRIWETALTFAGGNWPVSKSWTSTVFWGTLAWLSNGNVAVAVWGSIILHFLCGALAFDIGRRLSGGIGGLIFGGCMLLSPVLILQSFRLSTENTYAVTLLLSVWFMTVAERQVGAGLWRAAVWSCIWGVANWLCVWSRGEGMILWGVSGAYLLMLFADGRIPFCRMLAALTIGAGVFLGGALFTRQVNAATEGMPLLTCSSDNLWPRLIGANRKFDGTCNAEDKPLIRDRMIRAGIGLRGEKTPTGKSVLDFAAASSGCPKEAVPFVREEISRRWRSMSWAERIRFVIRKERIAWIGTSLAQHRLWFPRLADPGDNLVCVFAHALPSLAAAGGAVYFILALWFRRRMTLADFMPLILLGHVSVLAIAETSPRYGFVVYIIWPLFIAVVAGGFIHHEN